MYKYFIYFLLFINFIYAQNIDTLLQEYESSNENSLSTVDEKLGNVTIYSQKDLKLMQYTTLSDLLKEFPLSNLNKNKYGISNFSLPGTKTDVSGFFRFFINDHEITSNYTKALSTSWINLPIDLVDYIEVYRGNSSFALGNQSGIFFVRIYTKKPSQENGSQLMGTVASHGTNSQSLSHAETFENGWSYLTYFNKTKVKDHITNNGNRNDNDGDRRYFYLNIQKDKTDINIGYTDLKKDNYLGLALDGNSDYGEIDSQDYFIDFKNYFLDDKSIKMQISYDKNNLKYEEKNNEGLALIPVLDLRNLGNTIPKEHHQDNSIQSLNAFLSKKIDYGNNNFLFGINFQDKKYTTYKNTITNFANIKSEFGKFSNFDKEQIYSFLIQDDYKVNENLLFVANFKVDKFKRNGDLDNFSDNQYRIGGIYTPFENFGLKTFYTKTYIAPSFYNIDYASNNKNLKSQDYKYYTVQGVYIQGRSKFSLDYNNVKIKDFIYYSPVGFINIDHTVKTQGLIFDYTYEFSKNDKIQLNYFRTKLSETLNNSSRGGYIKYMGKYDSFEYFSSLIYRNDYKYLDVKVPESFNFNLGLTYNTTKYSSISLKGENLFDKSTKSLFQKGLSMDSFALEDYQREVTFSMKWVF